LAVQTTTYAAAIGDAASAFTVFAPDNAAFQAAAAFLGEASTDASAVCCLMTFLLAC
jgi:hypothetical protein